MGIFQRYVKTDKEGNPVLDKKGKPRREGPWFIQYPDSRDPKTGKVKYKTEKASFSKKKAETIFRAKMDAFQEKDKLGIQIDHDLSFDALMDWGLEQEVMKAKTTASEDLVKVNQLKSEFGMCKAIQITPLMVDNFKAGMKNTICKKTKRPYSGATINKIVSLGRRIYYLAMDAGKVKSNPFARRGTFKEEPKGRYIPVEHFWKIHGLFPDYMKPIVLMAYLTGMRRGEILNLEWTQIDLFGGFIDLEADDTKTEEPRRIYFNSLPQLKSLIIDAERNKKAKQKLVFVMPEGHSVSRVNISRVFRKVCTKASVAPYRFHDLRHTFNTNMLKAGVNQPVIMKLTGHKTNTMFLRYSHLDQEMGEAAMSSLEGLLKSKGEVQKCSR